MQYLFESYVLDGDRRELHRGGDVISIEPQVFDLLEYLINNRDRVVSKDDIFTTVWQGRVVSESALTTRINAARSAIGDNGEDQRLIRTLRGKGFRFIGEVREGRPLQPTDAPARAPELPSVVLALPDRPSIAVLPFVNMSGDPEQDYFADGIVDDIISGLSRIREFFVIARNSTFAYKGKAVDVRQIGRELGVRYLLEGSVRKADRRVRIAAQLVEAGTGAHIWSGRYDRDLDDIFAVQDEITQTVVAVLGPELSRAEQKRALMKPPENLGAWDLFQRGMFHLYKRTPEDNVEARLQFGRAIERDSTFAEAYAGICRTLSVDWIFLVPDRNANQAFEMGRRAVELDERSAMSHLAFGIFQILVRRDGDASLRSIEEAMRLNPNDATQYSIKGLALMGLGQAEEAASCLKQAIRLSPSDSNIGIFYGRLAMANLFLGRAEDAVEWGRKAEQRTKVWIERTALPAALTMLERDGEARQACEEFRLLWPSITLQTVRDNEPTVYPHYQSILLEGLRKAGLPEC